MSASLKGIVALISAAVAWIVWQKRQREAAARLAEIDGGTRCVACDGTELDRHADVARCLRCGYRASLASLRAAKVSSAEIANVTKPPEDRGMWR